MKTEEFADKNVPFRRHISLDLLKPQSRVVVEFNTYEIFYDFTR